MRDVIYIERLGAPGEARGQLYAHNLDLTMPVEIAYLVTDTGKVETIRMARGKAWLPFAPELKASAAQQIEQIRAKAREIPIHEQDLIRL